MKKTIIYLGLALVTVCTTAMASTVETAPQFELVKGHGYHTPLGMAIAKGDVETAKKIIEYGASVNERSNGMTPLMLAARYNNVELVNFLLEKGADATIKDDKGFTALKYADASNAKDAAAILKALK